MIRRLARSALGAAARTWPTPTYALVGVLARATAPLSRAGAAPERLQLVLPHLRRTELRRARLQLRSSEWKSRALGVVLNTASVEPEFPEVRLSAPLPDPTAPTVLVSHHFGAPGAIGAVLQRLPREVATLHRMEWRLPSNAVDVYVDHTEEGRAAGFHRALETVRAGGYAFMLIDALGIDVPVLGRTFSMSRGPFALSRLTGAPVVTLMARWSGGRVSISVGEAIPAGEEEEMALAAARNLERYLRAHPGEIADWFVDRLIGTPSLPPSA